MKRKLISIIVSLGLLISCISTISSNSFDAVYSYTSYAETEGDFEYKILDDGSAEITALNSEMTKVEIPAVIAGRNVTAISDKAIGYTKQGIKITDFVIKCYKGSIGEKYAKKNGFDYIYLPKEHTHTFKTTEVKANCTQGGGVLHICTVCNYSYSSDVTPPIGHKFGEWELSQKPDCENDGFECRYCKNCEYYEKRTVKAIGHNWSEPEFSWNGTSSASVRSICKNNSGHIHTDKAKITSKTEPADCTKSGKITYTASVSLDSKTYTDTKIVTIEKLSHSWGEPLWTWNSTDYAAAKFVCTNNKLHTTVIPAQITSVSDKATCTRDGKTTYTAKVLLNGKEYKDKKSVVSQSATGHSYTNWKTTKTDYKNAVYIRSRKCTACGAVQTRSETLTMQRFAGSDRFDTAAKISCESGLFDEADTVVLANGMNFADALAGVPLAAAYDAPILLTRVNSLPDVTLAEIKRLKAKNIIILGGEKAVGREVEQTLEENGYNDKSIKRLAGETRFGTAVKVAKQLEKKTGKTPDYLYFVVYDNFADALSAGTAAALSGSPILYVTKNGQPDKDTSAYIKSVRSSIDMAYIIGGTAVISSEKEKIVKELLSKPVERIWGKNRYETCIAINTKFADVLSGDHICAAKGLDFPDALAGGVFAAKRKAPLMLADNALSNSQITYLRKKNAKTTYVFGGIVAVPEALAKNIVEYSK